MLNDVVCERARQARDPRFDGRFFVGVKTTRIYCRPICPVALPKPKNVRFFQSAAAAAEAGFRPCLRCRPEVAPGSPAWRGSSATVSRALRLIDQGRLDEGGVEALALSLGIGTRHLSRLFAEQIGASPVSVAQTRRVHFAKQLIDETDLPMTEVALSAGFGSVRRFNALMQATYQRSPSALRQARRGQRGASEGQIALRLSYRPPFDWPRMLAFFRDHASDGVERTDDHGYRRAMRIDGRAQIITLRARDGQLWLHVDAQASRGLMDLVARVRAAFDLDANPDVIATHLGADPHLAKRLARHGVLRVPGSFDAFEMAIRAIAGQGVRVATACTFVARIVERHGERIAANAPSHLFPTPASLCDAPLEEVGLTRARADAMRGLARATLAGDPDALASTAGIGPWTRAYVALRSGDPDAFPAHDLVLRRAIDGRAMTARGLEALAEPWRPWRAYAAMLLWQR